MKHPGGDCMTNNQIAYWQLLETQRANRTREQETNRSNVAQEGLRRQEIAETGRHNYATEQLSLQDLTEKARSNRANESIKAQSNAIESGKLSETHRTNVANESLKAQANFIANRNATANLQNAATNSRGQQETARNNRVNNLLGTGNLASTLVPKLSLGGKLK